MILLLLSAIAIGFVLGLTGSGGGMFAVPALVASLGWSMQQAVPVALIAVAFGSAVAVVDGFRHKLVRYRAAILMACAGLPFTALGMWLAGRLSQRWLTGLFILVMLYVAVNLLRQARRDALPNTLMLGRINTETGRFHWTWLMALSFSAIGALAGFLAGLLGIGGGFVVVPMLKRFTNVSIQSAVATSLLMIVLIATGGVANALLRGVTLPLRETLLFTAATGTGIVIARTIAGRITARQIFLGFASLLFIVALAMLGKLLLYM